MNEAAPVGKDEGGQDASPLQVHHDNKKGREPMTTEEHTRLETLHGELLHEAASLAATGNFYDSSVATARAATLANELWGPA